MDSEVLAKAVLVGGALALVLGPALQAAGEVREYNQLLAALRESDLGGVAQDYLRWYWPRFLPRSRWRWVVLLLFGPLLMLTTLWPPVPRLRELRSLSRRYARALTVFGTAADAGDEDAQQLRAQLGKARNWMIIVAGAVLVLIGATIDLVITAVG